MNPSVDYVITYDQPGKCLVISTACGRAEHCYPYPLKRKPTLHDAIQAVGQLHRMLCYVAGLPAIDTAIGSITLGEEVYRPSPPATGDNGGNPPKPALRSRRDQHRNQSIPAGSLESLQVEPWS